MGSEQKPKEVGPFPSDVTPKYKGVYKRKLKGERVGWSRWDGRWWWLQGPHYEYASRTTLTSSFQVGANFKWWGVEF